MNFTKSLATYKQPESQNDNFNEVGTAFCKKFATHNAQRSYCTILNNVLMMGWSYKFSVVYKIISLGFIGDGKFSLFMSTYLTSISKIGCKGSFTINRFVLKYRANSTKQFYSYLYSYNQPLYFSIFTSYSYFTETAVFCACL